VQPFRTTTFEPRRGTVGWGPPATNFRPLSVTLCVDASFVETETTIPSQGVGWVGVETKGKRVPPGEDERTLPPDDPGFIYDRSGRLHESSGQHLHNRCFLYTLQTNPYFQG
jgi:hypothetical protein